MGQVIGLQWLRAAAALVVAVGHVLHDAKTHALKTGLEFERVHWLPWGSGVDLFFVISGFVMVYASERLFGAPGAGAAFLGRRIARIVPVYWLFLVLALVWMLASERYLGGKPAPDGLDILTSFLFWPFDGFEDGMPRPFYTLGWTLNYEMFFYAVFALFVGLGRNRAVLGVAAALTTLVAVGALAPVLPVPLAVWSKPIVLEFALGMGIALMMRHGVVLSGATRLVLGFGGLAILVADPLATGAQSLDWITPNDLHRFIGWGIPAAAIVAASVLGPRAGAAPRVAVPGGDLLARLGDASYVLYLLHPFAIVGVRKVWFAAGLSETFGLWPMMAAALALACAASLVLHRWLELPVTRWCQARLAAGPAPQAGPRAATTVSLGKS